MRYRSQRGFTLLEIMLTTIIFVGALIPILSLYQSGFISSLDTEIMTKCLNIGRAKVEAVKNLPYPFIEIGTKEEEGLKNVNTKLSDFLPSGAKQNFFRRIVQIEWIDKNNRVVYYETGLKKITVTVFAREKDGTLKRNIVLSTIRSNQVSW